MKVVLLAGGFGTRISEESHLRPKPMVEIGDRPILWHIMKQFSAQGFHEFVICLGYKQHIVKHFFADYCLNMSDVTIDLQNNSIETHNNDSEPWKVTLVDTGLHTMTGGRIKRIQKYIGDEPFLMTYGDGVCDIKIHDLLDFHRSHGKIATLTAVNIGQKFGIIDLAEDQAVRSFREKNANDGGLINGGYMVLEPEVFSYIEGDATVFEQTPLEKLAKDNELRAFKHDGFWQCMDTQRDKQKLENLWNSGQAPWKLWDS